MYEPLATLVRERMDAAGLRVRDLAEITDLDRRHVSQIINRTKPYRREVEIETMQALARIPNLDLGDIARAVAESVGRPIPAQLAPTDAATTPLRRSVHAVVDKIPDERLGEALQHLTTLLHGLQR